MCTFNKLVLTALTVIKDEEKLLGSKHSRTTEGIYIYTRKAQLLKDNSRQQQAKYATL